MDDYELARRVEGLETLMTDRFLQDRELWQAVYARIDAFELAFSALADVAQERHSSLTRELVDRLSFAEAEARSLNVHDGFVRQVRSLRTMLAEQLQGPVVKKRVIRTTHA